MMPLAGQFMLVVLGIAFAIEPTSWQQLPGGFLGFGNIPSGLSVALIFGAIAFAGSGGGQNLCQSNWIRDKGFGMGTYVPRLVSPITGQPEAKPSTGYIFEPTSENLGRWRGWWRGASPPSSASVRPRASARSSGWPRARRRSASTAS